ncbi:uncharacterized protein LOC124851149 isoform X2 [Hippoglossus stenolepis]|uniref:uncharacterized protein LOC124851149 isoform X2 n=1 Tax=Hippoglossus stenolepis TaxID=195615 RepID=UPI001FAED144|nr:uncharacterized protein LOC124851149 isoform X2 [Hippoglossus stenolepis]
MLFFLCLLFTGGICRNVADARIVTVLQNSVATLPCPHTAGDVSWSRLRNGDHVILVTITSGSEDRRDKRCGSLADNSLVISNVQCSDSAWYFCNRKQTVYLNVTTDPKDQAVTPGNDGLGFVLEPDHSGTDSENTQSDLWKIPVGAVIGAALVLLVLTVRLCSGRTADRNRDQPEAEGIYEEIRPPDVETVYNWSSVTEATASNRNVYSAVNKLKVKGHCTDTDCVYSFVQNPPQAGNNC